MERKETFGTALKNHRNIMGFSRRELAEECAIRHLSAPTERNIADYEQDQSLPRADKLAALGDVLRLTQAEVAHLVDLSERLRKNVPSSELDALT